MKNFLFNAAKRGRDAVLRMANCFLVPYLNRFYLKELKKIPEEVQLFFITRMDFGTFLYHIHYASCWEKMRGKACLVVLTPQIQKIKELSACLTPQIPLVCPSSFLIRLLAFIFRPFKFHDETFQKVYALLRGEYPHALMIFEPAHRSEYVASFDNRLKSLPREVSKSFVGAYEAARKVLNYRDAVLQDAWSLHDWLGLSRRGYLEREMEKLKQGWNIGGDYVVINLNCKNYPQDLVKRPIHHPSRYDCVIDLLIEKGFTVVLQGRKEQPKFKKRNGLIDYARSGSASIAHDLALYSGCHFAIANKTGAECFCMICNTPLLGLNYVELSNLIFNTKLRFFPKHALHRGEGRFLTWKEWISSHSFFDIGRLCFDSRIEWVELREEELIAAVEEFIPLATQPHAKWLEYSPRQLAFKQCLHPLHLDLYASRSAPCDAYLKLDYQSAVMNG